MKAKKIITTTKSVDFDIVSATLLTVEEAKQLPDEILTAVHDNWWLRSPGNLDEFAACVFGEDAHIYDDGEYVDMKLGVRPAIIFMSSELEVGDKFKAFDYEWTVISSNKALCNTLIGKSPFCKDWRKPNANNYETSDVKKYLDKWFTHYMNTRLRIQDKIDEVKQHLEELEFLRDGKEAWLSFYKEHGKDVYYDETKALINALDFAIDFIKWGMKN